MKSSSEKKNTVSLQDLLSYVTFTLVFRRTAQPAAATAAAADHTSTTRLELLVLLYNFLLQ